VRPGAGALLAAATMYQIDSPLLACVLGLCVGAPTAMVPHATKAAARAVSSTFTMGLANPLLSFGEDGITIVIATLAILAPLAALATVLLVVWVVRRAFRRRPVAT
jgi:hypothetical protein